jgi:hypothetical protein
MPCACTILSSVVCPPPPPATFFPRHQTDGAIFEGKKSYWTLNVCFHFLYNFVINISHSKNNWARYDRNCISVLMQCTCYSCQISIKHDFLYRFPKNSQTLDIMKLRSMGAKLSSWMDGRLPDVSQVWPSIAGEANNTKGLKQDPLGRISGDLRKHKLEKIIGDGEGNKKYPARQCKVWQTDRPDKANSHFLKFWERAKKFLRVLSAPIQTGSGAHPASCTMGTGSFPGVKAAGAWCWPHTPF